MYIITYVNKDNELVEIGTRFNTQLLADNFLKGPLGQHIKYASVIPKGAN